MPHIGVHTGPDNAADEREPDTAAQPGQAAAAEPPDPTPAPAQGSTQLPGSPASSAPKAARATPTLSRKKDDGSG